VVIAAGQAVPAAPAGRSIPLSRGGVNRVRRPVTREWAGDSVEATHCCLQPASSENRHPVEPPLRRKLSSVGFAIMSLFRASVCLERVGKTSPIYVVPLGAGGSPASVCGGFAE
jgi:hypothetical protein